MGPSNYHKLENLMSPLNDALAALRQEKANLGGQLARVHKAIVALTGAPAKKTKKKAIIIKKTIAKQKRKPMSAEAKKALSARMKKYWAARRKAAGRQ